MSLIPLLYRDWWEDLERPTSLFDQHFGIGLNRNNLISSLFNSPLLRAGYVRPWRELSRQSSGTSMIHSEGNKFQVLLDVQQFAPSEITVKTQNNVVVVEGKHEEKQDEHGFVSRHFVRKYVLPTDIDPTEITSSLSSDGVLTITAPKKEIPAITGERVVPIQQTGQPALKPAVTSPAPGTPSSAPSPAETPAPATPTKGSLQSSTNLSEINSNQKSSENQGKVITDTTGMQQPHGRGYPPPTYLGPQSQLNAQRAMYAASVYHHQYQAQAKQTNQLHPTHYPVHPDVKLKKLPFYEVSAELVKPSSLVPQGSQRQQDSTFVFHLTPQQATAIGMSRDMRPGSKVEYTVQVQLRFCLLETTSEQEDCFPPGIIVKVNNKICPLPNPIPTNKPGVEPKRPPRPVNITPLIKISPTVGNSIHVQWSTDYTRGYVVAVYLVHKKTSEDLLNRLKAKGVRGADYTRGMIKDKLNEDADSEIATTSLRVSLVCPLGKMRMVTPCRASTCQHLQCFDASLYLQMNERKPTWMCPVCDKPAIYDKLVIDGYFQEVLLSGRLSHDGNEIQLHSDGSWSSLVIKKEQSRVIDQGDTGVMKLEAKVEMLDVEPEVIPEKAISSNQTSVCESQSNKGTNKKEEVIDLTLSDSDDEPLMPRKKQIPDSSDQINKNCDVNNLCSTNRTTSVSSSGQHSPSLIILDGDSPPPTPTTMVNSEAPRPPPPPYISAVSYLASQSHFLDLDADSTFPQF